MIVRKNEGSTYRGKITMVRESIAMVRLVEVTRSSLMLRRTPRWGFMVVNLIPIVGIAVLQQVVPNSVNKWNSSVPKNYPLSSEMPEIQKG